MLICRRRIYYQLRKDDKKKGLDQNAQFAVNEAWCCQEQYIGFLPL